MDVLDKARSIQQNEADRTTVFIPLSLLEALIDEIDRLRAELAPLRQGVRDEEERVVALIKDRHEK